MKIEFESEFYTGLVNILPKIELHIQEQPYTVEFGWLCFYFFVTFRSMK